MQSFETELFGAILGFHKKTMMLIRAASLDDEALAVVSDRINTVLDTTTAEMKQARDFNLAERLESAYRDIEQLVGKLSKRSGESKTNADSSSGKTANSQPMILRLSQKLATKLKAGSLTTKPLGDNPLADWSAHLFDVNRTQYILLSNTKSLYSTVMFGKGITSESVFIERALASIRELLEADGQAFVYLRFIVPATGTVSFAKALDRSVTGSMNELIKHATCWLAEGNVSPFDVGLRLNDVLLSSLADSKSSSYGRPAEAFRELAKAAKA